MNNEHNLRLTYIFFGFLSFYFILILYLYILQIKNGPFYTNLANNQYHGALTTFPARAEIYDRNNNPLSINVDSISAFITPCTTKNKDSLKNYLIKEFPQAYQKLDNSSNSNFIYLKRKLTEEELQSISNAHQDIKLLKEPNRYYPNETLGPVIGVTSIDNEGISGLEYLYNQALSGEHITYALCKDARSGYFFLENKLTPSNSTQNLKTTLDSTLQFLIHEELEETVKRLESKYGAVLIMNPDNGEILTMATYPTFNPNNFNALDLENNKNHIACDAYELGSVIKIFLAMAALEEQVVSIDEEIDCENKLKTTLNGISFGTTKAHKSLPFKDVVSVSNNIGMAKVALRLGPKIYDHYKQMGFGKKIGIFPGENGGILTEPAKWSKASAISLSFGYEISASLLQLAQAMTIIANDGYLVTPKIIMDYKNVIKSVPLYNVKTIHDIKEIMHKTANKIMNNKKYTLNGFKIMGKTGTARLLTDGLYDPDKNIFTFAGIIEKGNFKRIVITFIKETTQKNVLASVIAAPLFEKVIEKLVIHEKLLTS